MVNNNEDPATFGKPDIVLFYNAKKGGVDTVDKYKAMYCAARTTNRWSMAIFNTMLNVGALNTFIILKKNINQPRQNRRRFIQDLAKELCRGLMVFRLTVNSLPQNTKTKIQQVMGIEEDCQRIPPIEDIIKDRCYFR